MESIIVDANKVFAAFIVEGVAHDLLFSGKFKPVGPEKLLEEVEKYFALALRFDFSIWSNEKAFKKQSKVKVFSTSDLISFLSGI